MMENKLLELAKAERKDLPVTVKAAFDKLEQVGKAQKQLEALEKALKKFLSDSIPNELEEVDGIEKQLVSRYSPRYKVYAEYVICNYVPEELQKDAREIPEDMVTESTYPKFVRVDEED